VEVRPEDMIGGGVEVRGILIGREIERVDMGSMRTDGIGDDLDVLMRGGRHRFPKQSAGVTLFGCIWVGSVSSRNGTVLIGWVDGINDSLLQIGGLFRDTQHT